MRQGSYREFLPFCAAAARLDQSLVENQEELHVIPASYEIEEGLKMAGTKVLMKAGRKIPYVKQVIKEQNLNLTMVENCGMENETIYHSAEEIPDEASYYSLFIVKEKKIAEGRRRNDRICRSRTGSGRSDHSAGTAVFKRSGHYHLCRVTGKSGSFAGKKKKAVKYITAPI